MKTGLALIALLFVMTGCTGVPKGIEPVTGFDQQRYLGTWYEIARLDHSFEEGLSQVTAEYSLNNDDSIKVVNRGYNAEAGEWKEAEGRAVFVGDSNIGHLKYRSLDLSMRPTWCSSWMTNTPPRISPGMTGITCG